MIASFRKKIRGKFTQFSSEAWKFLKPEILINNKQTESGSKKIASNLII